MKCIHCNSKITLERNQIDRSLYAACECEDRAVKVKQKLPVVWNDE